MLPDELRSAKAKTLRIQRERNDAAFKALNTTRLVKTRLMKLIKMPTQSPRKMRGLRRQELEVML